MIPRVVPCGIVLTLLTAAPVYADTPRSAQQWAEVGDGETAQIDLQTLRKFGDSLGRFDVLVAWADRARPAPADYAARTVRYMADCDAGTIMLAAVALYDRNGDVARTMIVPPRSVDPVTPEKGSAQAKWLQRVCMF